jgi:hypothetical protein
LGLFGIFGQGVLIVLPWDYRVGAIIRLRYFLLICVEIVDFFRFAELRFAHILKIFKLGSIRPYSIFGRNL